MKKLTIWLNSLVNTKFCFVAVLLPFTTAAQLTLEGAIQTARNNYPLIKQKDLINQTASINIENLSKSYWPQLTLSGQASYQSDVTNIDIPLPGVKIEPLSKDQYKVVADVNQLIYDGGLIREQKELQTVNARVEEERLEVELYKLSERISQLYLSILLIDEQVKQMAIVESDLVNGIKRVEAQVQNGTAFKSNLNSLKAEQLKNDQRLIELRAMRKGLIQMLDLFLHQNLNENVVLVRPVTVIPGTQIRRPELRLYQEQMSVLEQQNRLIKARKAPKTSLFLQAGYGRPGLNFLKNEFTPYAITGVRFNWSLGGYYTAKRERELIGISKRTIDLQKETFVLNTNTQLQQQKAEIEKYEQLIEKDLQIIELRKSVKEAAKAQLENAVITSSDYLREVNAEDNARQMLILHQLQLLQAQINYTIIQGK
ncbi:MAG: TolC family protein [Flavisolibacter sp.]|nr:TolC family protein [Flavisolibacter sp.]